MCSRTNTNTIEWIFFEILCLYFLSFCVSINCWKFQPPNADIDRSWAMYTEGQDICAYKKYKQRYYVCKQATKKKMAGGAIIPENSLGKQEEMKKKIYECPDKPAIVYFNTIDQNTKEYLKSERFLFTCPTSDPEGKKYFFSRGRNNNEIGIYKTKFIPKYDKVKFCFVGVMKDIDLDFFGNWALKIWSKIPILNILAPIQE